LLLILSLPVLVGGITTLLTNKNFNTIFFDYTGGVVTLLFISIYFDFFWHPEVYIIILPACGVISYVLSFACKRSVFGYLGMVYAILSIGFLEFLV
jgi:heme/copper-type cytochrome/quinol oxidase subunit 1